MNSNKMSLLFNAKLSAFEKLNDNFLKAKCYVLALGKNQNKSHFSKENVDKAYSTLAYVPVIGHLITDENGNKYLGGHDYKLDISTMSLKSQCVPFGFAIPDEFPVYENITEADGTSATYLVSNVVLWIGRYPELTEAFYDENTYFGQSMEILYSKSEKLKEDPTFTDIIDFSFDALCMLNKSDDPKFNIEPCFPNSSIKPITYGIDKSEFSLLMNEMKEQLSFCLNNNNNKQGGKTLDEKNEVLQKYNKTIKDLDFSIDDMTVEELTVKMEELYGEKTSEPVAFSATYNQKREALRNALDPVVVKDSNGNYVEETYFYVSDFDDTHVFVEVDYWNSSGDYSCKYGRYSYTFEDTTITATINDDFEEMVKVWMTLAEKAKLDEDRVNYEAISTEYDTYKNEYSYPNSEYEKLQTYKSSKESEERLLAEEFLFAEYEDEIGGKEEFSELKKNAKDYSIGELEKECLCIVGKYTRASKKTELDKEPLKGIKFSIEKPVDEDDEPYGGLIKKYLNK